MTNYRDMPALVARERKEKKLRKKHGEEPSTKEKLVAYLKGSHNYRNMPELVKDQKRRTRRAVLKERLEKQRDR
jgi:hypothetical protein